MPSDASMTTDHLSNLTTFAMTERFLSLLLLLSLIGVRGEGPLRWSTFR